jgi:hypothetical protein
MREADYNRKLFHRAHYNILAKQFRENIQPYVSEDLKDVDFADVRMNLMVAGVTLVNFAVSVAIRLQADNEDFDPVRFLDACSPNVEKFPFGQLWEVVSDETAV